MLDEVITVNSMTASTEPEDFEIGLVYQRGKRYFIAVDDKVIVGCRDGRTFKIRPTTTYRLVRSISVEKLCEHWGVELERFDELMAEYLHPRKDLVKTRPRGSKRVAASEDEYWRRQRTGRITRPGV